MVMRTPKLLAASNTFEIPMLIFCLELALTNRMAGSLVCVYVAKMFKRNEIHSESLKTACNM